MNMFREWLSKIVPANGTSPGGNLDKRDWYAVLFNAGLVSISAGAAALLSAVPSMDFGGYDQILMPVFVFGLKALEKWAKDNEVK